MNQDENPFAPPLADLTQETPADDVERIRHEYLRHETSVRSIGLLYYLSGGMLMLAGVSGLWVVAVSGRPGPVEALLLMFIAFVAGLSICVGTGLRRLASWVRLPVGVMSGIGLLAGPVGLLINGYILYLVFCKKGNMVFSDEYAEVIRQTPHIEYKSSCAMLILIVLVATAFLLFLALLITG